MSFVAGDPSVGKKGTSSLTVSGGDKVADGKQTHTATATVLDAHQNPVGGVTVTFSVPSESGALLSEATAKTNRSGVATVTVTSVTAGKIPVSATVAGTELRRSPGTVSFVAGDPSLGKKGTSSLRVSAGDRVASGEEQHTATATVLDANKNPVSGATVAFSVPADSGATLSETTATTNAQGVATVSVTSTVAGQVPVTATVGDRALRGSPGTVRFIAGPADASRSSWSVSPEGPVTADGEQGYTGTATIRDRFENPVEGETVVFSAPEELGGERSRVSDAAGNAVVEWKTTQAGSYPVRATLADGTPIGDEFQLVFVAGPAD
ncbi:Ig-like domain-containing protein, partial [Leucobacter sp. M11]|uniref:Ig-like domain-containing protein n=1 Tax=Leucobacter sp. M11 TaxID=2993565 RepID=UPI002D808BBE